MTAAERQARHRAKRAANKNKPPVRFRRPLDRRSRVRRWTDAVAELVDLQAEYAAWLEVLPENLQEGATADALRAVCDLNLMDLQAVTPPRGFGRD